MKQVDYPAKLTRWYKGEAILSNLSKGKSLTTLDSFTIKSSKLLGTHRDVAA